MAQWGEAARRRAWATALAVAGLSLAGTAMASSADRARTDLGVVEGLGPQASGVREFRGIPFAAPPIGDLRWKAPQPAQPWRGVREAKAFGPRCMQAPIYSDMVFRSAGVSEDCLYLNVWTPAKSAHEHLPVLVYFYGGGYRAGDGSEPRYDGEAMAAKGIVVVTLSYRLGVFGFFSHPELSAESPHGGSGNQGLLDQTAALQWVRRNISAFGGDPRRVTIAGESAGSVSVSVQMASPQAKGLFAGAIGESGSLLGTLPALSLAEAEGKGTAFAGNLGAKSLADLRAAPAQAVLDAAGKPGTGFEPRPVVDGWFLPKSPREIFEAGEQARVPLLAGSNTEEGGAASVLDKAAPTVDAYRQGLTRLYGDKADAVFAAYPAAADGEPVLEAARNVASDRFIALSTWRWMDLSTRTGGQPTFYYLYARPRPATKAAPDAPRPSGAVHSAEIEYALGHLDLNPVYAWTPDDRATSRALQGYFANFIKTGDPNGTDLPVWPRYGTGLLMRIDANPKAEPDLATTRRQALEAATPR
jgi:para-nitrobenzyl esterase